MDQQIVKHYEQVLKANIMQIQLNGASLTLSEQVAQLVAKDRADQAEIRRAYDNVVRELVGEAL